MPSQPPRIQLFFTSSPSLELLRVVHSSPLLSEELVSVRGKTSGAYQAHANFQWTNAVKALALLFVHAGADICTESGAHLEGSSGTPAASLDHALGKPPLWLLDMFGCDSSGRPLLHRYLHRSNAERKRGGSVALSINTRVLAPEQIEIYVDQTKIAGKLALGTLSSLISGSEMTQNTTPSSPLGVMERILGNALEREIRIRLAGTDIFSERKVDEVLRDLNTNRRFQDVAGGKTITFLEQIIQLNGTERFGEPRATQRAHNRIKGENSFNVALSVSQAGALGIFSFLRTNGLPFELSLEFQSSLGLVDYLTSQDDEPPELCVLALAPAARLIACENSNYTPLMMMPRQSYALLAPVESGGRVPKPAETFLVNDEEHSNAHFFLDKLIEYGPNWGKELSLEHADPHEVSSAFRQGDSSLRTILGFPYYCLLEALDLGVGIPDLPDEIRTRESFLFVRSDLCSDESLVRALSIVVRDAWLTLLENPSDVKRIAKAIVKKSDYCKWAGRFGGAYGVAAVQNP